MLSGGHDERINGGIWDFLSVITSNDSMYSVPIGNSRGLVITLSVMAMEANESSSLMAMKIFRYFTGRLTGFSDSELPNSTVIVVV